MAYRPALLYIDSDKYLPDVLFEALIVAGLVVLIWRPRPGPWAAVFAGLVPGAAADVCPIGEVLVIPAVVFVFLAAAGWRRRLTRSALLAASFAVPIVMHMTASAVVTWHFGMTRRGADVLYGRSAFAADCGTLPLPLMSVHSARRVPSPPLLALTASSTTVTSHSRPASRRRE